MSDPGSSRHRMHELARKVDAHSAALVNDLMAGYTWGYDVGSGDDACFTLHKFDGKKSHTKVIAYGKTAQLLAAALESLRGDAT